MQCTASSRNFVQGRRGCVCTAERDEVSHSDGDDDSEMHGFEEAQFEAGKLDNAEHHDHHEPNEPTRVQSKPPVVGAQRHNEKREKHRQPEALENASKEVLQSRVPMSTVILKSFRTKQNIHVEPSAKSRSDRLELRGRQIGREWLAIA